MPVRQIIPVKFTITVSSGEGTFDTGILAGTLRRIVFKAPGGPAVTGRIKLRDEDRSFDIFIEPEPGEIEVDLKFFQLPIEIPVNGDYSWALEDVTRDGDYTGYYILEERQTIL